MRILKRSKGETGQTGGLNLVFFFKSLPEISRFKNFNKKIQNFISTNSFKSIKQDRQKEEVVVIFFPLYIEFKI